jgi:hypothetical protein
MEILYQYFREEKAESLFFMAVGVAAIAVVLYVLLARNEALLRGAAIPLAVVGLIQVVVGGSVYFRTDSQVAALEQQFSVSSQSLASHELPRMATVNRNFVYYRYIETAFVLMGVLLMLGLRRHDFWLGIGMGMLAQGTLMLLLDLFAERRADMYTAWLTGLH